MSSLFCHHSFYLWAQADPQVDITNYKLKKMTTQEISSLPNHGPATCTYMHYPNQKIGAAHVCRATLLSSSQVIMDSACILPPMRQSQVIFSCLGNAFQINIDNGISPQNVKDLSSGLKLIKLPHQLDFIPPQMATSIIASELLNDFKDCTLTNEMGTIAIKPEHIDMISTPYKIKVPSDLKIDRSIIGGSFNCKYHTGIIKTLGVINQNFEIVPSWLLDDNLESLTDAHRITINDRELHQEIYNLCNETGACINSLTDEAQKLTINIEHIITHLNKEFRENAEKTQALKQSEIPSTQKLEHELEILRDLFRETVQSCHQEKSRLYRSDARNPDGSLGSFLFGGLTNTFAKTFYNDNDFANILYDNIKDDNTDRLLGSKEQVIQKINAYLETGNKQGLSMVQKLGNAALSIARDIVTETLVKEHGMDKNDPRIGEALSVGTKEFEECLNAATSANYDISSCASKFKENIPSIIGKTILSAKLDENFKNLYRNDGQGYLKLTQNANQTYDRCIATHYHSDVNKHVSSNGRAQACVYSAFLSSFDGAATNTVASMLKRFPFKPKDRQETLSHIRNETLSRCPLAQTIQDANNLTNEQFRSLTQMNIQDITDNIYQCKDNFALTAAPIVLNHTLNMTPEFNTAFPNESIRNEKIKILTDQFFIPCIQLLQKTTMVGRLDPTQCENLITMEASFMVVDNIMQNAIEEQFKAIVAPNNFSDTDKKEMLELKLKIQLTIKECKSDLENQHYEALKNNTLAPNENKMIQCMSQGIRLIAEAVAQKTIDNQIAKTPELKLHISEINQHPTIKNLARDTGDCFELKINTFDNTGKLASGLDSIRDACVLDTERRATLILAPILMSEKLKLQIPDQKAREIFVENFMEAKGGMRQRLNNATNKNEFDSIMSQIQTDVTMNYAKDYIPATVGNYLRGQLANSNLETQETKRISNIVLKKLETCSREAGNKAPADEKSRAYDGCVRSATVEATQLVAGKLIEHNIKENLSDEKIALNLAQSSNSRLKQCTQNVLKISETLSSEQFSQNTNNCIASEVFSVSREVPKLVLTQVSNLTGSKLLKEQLQKELKKVDDFYYGGKTNVELSKDQTVVTYQSLLTCLKSKEYEYHKNKQSIEDALKSASECTNTLRGHVVYSVKHNYLTKNFPGQKEEHSAAIGKTIDILMLLQGKPDPNGKDDNQDLSEVISTVIENMIKMCNYSPNDCNEKNLTVKSNIFAETLKKIEDAKKKNPNMTSKEIQEFFYNSPLMKRIIDGNVAMTLRHELKNALVSMDDGSGILSREINRITSPATFDKILRSHKGEELNRILLTEVKKGNIANAASSPSVRRLIGEAITNDVSNDSFIDRLMYGIAQPMIQRESKSTKVALGNFFGIVDRKNFDWEKIRNTQEGRDARLVFADLIEKGIAGEISMDTTREGGRGQKSAALTNGEKRIRDLIEKALKNMPKASTQSTRHKSPSERASERRDSSQRN